MGKLIDLTGRQFGRLTVVRLSGETARRPRWLCLCACGAEVFRNGETLREGDSVSCGCLNNESRSARATMHGLSKSKIYSLWHGMTERCRNPNHPAYSSYGGRGIYVCERWQNIESFVEDMGERPPGTSLDRINNDGPYSKENCAWRDAFDQMNNTRANKFYSLNGDRLTVAQAARIAGISYAALYCRLKTGMSIDMAVSKPIARKKISRTQPQGVI